MKSIGTFLVLVFFIVSCKAPTGAEDIGDIDRTQPDKVESVQDSFSDPDYIYSQNDDESYGDGTVDGDRWYYQQGDFSTNFDSTDIRMAQEPFRYY